MKSKYIFFVLIIFFLNTSSAQSEAEICQFLFSSSYEITELSNSTIKIAIEAVFGASELAGYTTITGTLTQNPGNPGVWTFSADPSDKLLLKYSNGVTLEFVFTVINGYTEGTAEDFGNSHTMDFTAVLAGLMNVRIQSSTYWENGTNKWQRSVTGSVMYNNENMNVSIPYNGEYTFDIGGGIALYNYSDAASGTASTGSFSIDISESYSRAIAHNSNDAIFVLNTNIWNNSSTTVNNNTYRYQNAYVFWAAGTHFADSANAGIYNKVIDGHQWEVAGVLLKNNQVYGQLQFSDQVYNGTSGPDLILYLSTGENVFLHTLINDGTAVSIDSNIELLSDFELGQNYPNPFNPSTIIKFTIPETEFTIVKVFNMLGQEVAVLVNEIVTAGSHEVKFQADNLVSGIYVYTIQAGEFTASRKMMLMK